MTTHSILKNPSTDSGTLARFLNRLHSVKLHPFGEKQSNVSAKVLTNIFSYLATLLENGVTLPKALQAVSDEDSLKRQRSMLLGILHAVERGASFSGALEEYPAVFDNLLINQIKIGEKSGTVAEVLRRIASSLEESNQLRRKILKRLSYPLVVTAAGFTTSIFMVMFIVPVFEETYQKSNIQLPWATQLLIYGGNFLSQYGWAIALAIFFAAILYRKLRKDKKIAAIIDEAFLKTPVLGTWLRDFAMLQFMDSLGTMLQSGYKLADALIYSCGSVSNQAVDKAIRSISQAVLRGERLSDEMSKHQKLFSPVVSQLVIIGEQTGTLAKASEQVREFLKKDIERKTDTVVSALEPILTILMAFLIGGILLAIYMPMFGMLDLIDQ